MGTSEDAAAVPPPVPDWIARALGFENGADFDSCYLENTYYEVPKREIVRLLASVRESALHEAAAVGYCAAAPEMGPETSCGVQGNVMDAILALIDEPPGNIP